MNQSFEKAERIRACKTRRHVTLVTAYDYPTGRLLDEAGVDIVLVGDSLGTVSYTHLQHGDGMKSPAADGLGRVSEAAGAGHPESPLEAGAIRRFPVSYTHLDVYKRQELLPEKCPRTGEE